MLALDAFMILFWLACLGAVAAKRATFVFSVNATCVNDGSAFNSGKCTINKRAIVMDQASLGVMSGVAGVAAIEWFVLHTLRHVLRYKNANPCRLLFIASFVLILRAFLQRRKAIAPPKDVAGVEAGVEMEHKQPFLSQTYPSQTQPAAQPYVDAQQHHNMYQQSPPSQYQTPIQPQHTGQTFQSIPSVQYQNTGQMYPSPTPPPGHMYPTPPPGQQMYPTPPQQNIYPNMSGQGIYQGPPPSQSPAHEMPSYPQTNPPQELHSSTAPQHQYQYQNPQ